MSSRLASSTAIVSVSQSLGECCAGASAATSELLSAAFPRRFQGPPGGRAPVGSDWSACSEPVAHFLRDQTGHRAKSLHKFGEDRRARGGHQFVRFIALGDRDAAGAQDLQGRRRRHWKSAVRAVHPARSLGDRSRQNAGFAEEFNRDTRSHDIDDRINGAHFMEMNLFRRMAVDFSFRPRRCAMENRRRPFPSPRAKACWLLDQLADFD